MNVKNIVLGIGIFIVYIMMVMYGIQVFFPAPEYEDFCSNDRFQPKIIEPAAQCPRNAAAEPVQSAGQLCYESGGFPEYNYNNSGCIIGVKRCNYCQKDFNDARLNYEKEVFIIAIIIGLITLFIGYGILSAEPVGSSLMASGIGAIFYGGARNWENLGNIWRFLLLLVALISLIWIALQLNKPNMNWKFWK